MASDKFDTLGKYRAQKGQRFKRRKNGDNLERKILLFALLMGLFINYVNKYLIYFDTFELSSILLMTSHCLLFTKPLNNLQIFE